GEARGLLRQRRRPLEERRAHDGRTGTKRQRTAEKAAAGDCALDHPVELLNLGAGEVELVPLVGGEVLRIDVFHGWLPDNQVAGPARTPCPGGSRLEDGHEGAMTVTPPSAP